MLPLHCWCLFTFLLLIAPSAGFFGWLTRSTAPESPPAPPTAAPNPGHLPHVPFEMTTADERFLAEARLLHSSPLDSCHQKVVAQLQASCSDLTEEELAKLGVSLFNCQASVEGRRTYHCTVDMSLAECTAEMDPDTWNAYHIVSNRARAVCYATRQMQFKRRTEHTVNALVSTAVSQLEAMQMLKSGQEELRELTSESLQKVASSQQELLAQQERMQGSQEQMEESLHDNLAQLTQEKALIASGHQHVAQLIEGITRRMENVSTHLDNQDMDLQEGHKAILRDLTQVQKRAQEVYSKIETNLGLFLAYQNQTALYYEELMGKLHKMNESLGLVLFAVDHMQRSVEGRLQHIQRFISWAGFSLSSIYTCVLHGSYFLLAALIMTFLQIPGLPRAMLLVLVVANALLELHHATSLGFSSLTSLLLLTVAGNWLLGNICRCALRWRLKEPNSAFLALPQKVPETYIPAAELKNAPCRHRLTSTPDREEGDVGLLKEELEKLEEMSYVSDGPQLEQEYSVKAEDVLPDQGAVLEASRGSLSWKPQQSRPLHSMSLRRVSLSCSTRHKQATLERWSHHHLGPAFSPFPSSRDCSPNESRISDVSDSSASPRQLCQGVTRTGQQCRKKAVPGHMFCRIHASGQASYAS
ncbi:protein brambleberry-like isoform X2 [Hemicordylus capensis]|nr:protein brambleberry-like isoform X2 [Hemicordylus capensis]XP_053101638.1 protein brambleberry-like isoform X2 [Hemicordylus capensis]XP_053101639.1 protein brambleberry-like isoform X2 [Hemicordylus capensis]XP_053101641.1 protein brambleberry-like isoform X2 [Hemicordylus capensis]